MSNQNELTKKEAKDLADTLALKYRLGPCEINEVLTACGTDKNCIKRKFSEIADLKIKEAVKRFQNGNSGPEPS